MITMEKIPSYGKKSCCNFYRTFILLYDVIGDVINSMILINEKCDSLTINRQDEPGMNGIDDGF